MEKTENFLNRYLLIFILLICLPAVWALFVPGYYGASDDLHVSWLYEMDRTVKMGQIPPRFVPDLSFQFGYPLFNFVFPLPFYLAEAFHLLGLNLVDSIKAVFLISVPLSFIFMYRLLREFCGTMLSFLGATIYLYTPYRATDLYVRGAIGEILGFALLPLICLSLIKLADQKRLINKWLGIGAMSVAALVLTHDITAYMFLPFVAILGASLLLVSKRKLQTFTALLGMGIFGLLVSLYFWLPAIMDSRLMKYDTVFNFIDHFPTLKQLITPFWGYGASVPGPYDGMSFFIGVANWVLIFLGIPLLFLSWKKIDQKQKIMVLWSYFAFAAAMVLMNYRSIPIWNVLPELPYFQFPWRFLILTTFVTPLLVILLEKIKAKFWWAILLVGLVIGGNAFQFRPHDFLGRNDNYYLDRYIPYPQASEAYILTQEEYLRLSVNTSIRPYKIYPIAWADQAELFNLRQDGLNEEASTDSSGPGTISFNKYNFPGWRATVDDQEAQIKPGQPFGQVTVPVPAGLHKVKINFQETRLKLILDLISLFSLGVAILLSAGSYLNLRKKQHV